MFDIIGKRNWFFLISLLVTIPGLIFILLTPITGGKEGIQFTIDYTGGTTWQIRFANGNVTPDQVAKVFHDNNEQAIVVQQQNGFMEIKTTVEAMGLLPAAPSATPPPAFSPSASVDASGSPAPSGPASAGPSASPAASGSAAPSASPSAAPSASPASSGSPAPTGSAPAGSAAPSPSPSAATGNTQLPTTGKGGEMVKALEAALGPIAEQASLTTIGAVVSSDLVNQALILIVVGSLGILLWITYRFQDVKFGVTALVALVHDVIVVVGIFAILGTVFRLEIDALFVTAMLTVIGFSVHDTIVVFDRIRENRARHAGEPFAEIVNHSILQTFARSIMTSFTVVLTLLSLYLFGGEAIRTFVLALLIGIVSGTYSSIFNASPLLVVWHEWEDRRLGRAGSSRTPRARRATS
ncbi:MAG TPA: protein translocase subunit SecF [Candidatus Limnocylindrales bacterium]|nr:protein translocase subunit SecF [Candidatus Limnocylindrales bacterium]